MSSWREESYNFFLGGPPKLQSTDPVVKDTKGRVYLTTMSSGTVHIQVDVILKGLAS